MRNPAAVGVSEYRYVSITICRDPIWLGVASYYRQKSVLLAERRRVTLNSEESSISLLLSIVSLADFALLFSHFWQRKRILSFSLSFSIVYRERDEKRETKEPVIDGESSTKSVARLSIIDDIR